MTATVLLDEDICYKVNPGSGGYSRTFEGRPLPHWECSYDDGTTRDGYVWHSGRPAVP